MITTIVIFIFLLFVLVISHECGHFFAARASGIRVEEFGFGIPPRITGFRRGGTLYSINWLPVGGFVKIFGEEGGSSNDPQAFGNKSAWVRGSVLLSGIVANFILAWILLSAVSMIGLPVSIADNEFASYPDARLTITDIAAGSPAEKANLKVGDTIEKVAVGAEGVSHPTVHMLQELAHAHTGEFITLTIKHGEVAGTLSIESRVNPPAGEGPLGIAIDMLRTKKASWYEAPIEGARLSWHVGQLTVSGIRDTIYEVFQGRGGEVQVSGPVGVFFLTQSVREAGFASLLFFVAALSISLGLFNILPIPGLDGGRFLFLLIEVITGKKISERASAIIHGIGLVLLLILIALITRLDIKRYF